MTVGATGLFAINTYAYMMDISAAEAVRRLAGQGYPAFEVMMYPGHCWPGDPAGIRDLRRALDDTGTHLVATNMPNIDLNVAGASEEMRAYSVDLISGFIACSGDLASPAIVLGPGKANPLFPGPVNLLKERFFRALDVFAPLGERHGVQLLIENIAFAFLPDAPGLMAALDAYGHDGVKIIYDVANAHFIGEDPAVGLRQVAPRLGLVHFSDTNRRLYRHDAVGLGDVPFAGLPAVLDAVGYRGFPVLEVISETPDRDILASAEALAALGFGRRG